ncbi:non-hemolytic phospholipase C (phosphatidylcholine choline phospho hydrolase) signal peptide protein [Herbaspirillum rubrisubalbicans M1]|uniref:phospholipase C n=2 Tax=Herbaspirillum rubrisubalbicans TaxID=80842 RepID=A0AAD0U7T7_9BURK|nr:non-hemolytic phospholipase C (phosphatidylcholine choline phospho hydrolase) signal peptide protein [Herbaspirillum rubrisubalbicans M1]AYR24943.1 phospholipase C, phosphocholine-specific [Herbaspirillum rubrisubalbicans]
MMSMKRNPYGRRNFLKAAARSGGAALALSSLPASIRKALAIAPSSPTGSIKDVKHVVILMQENRSFDHYFGCLKGVRGFGDSIPRPLPDGNPVFYQRDAQGKLVLPYRLEMATTSAGRAGGNLPHAWKDQHAAWNRGDYDRWIEAKKDTVTMGYFTREDLPFHYALAEAFTICDAYHCSVLGSTNPNRFHLMSGGIDLAGRFGGPMTYQPRTGAWSGVPGQVRTGADSFRWMTYPERLEQHQVSWKVYQGTDEEQQDHGDYPSDFNVLQYFFNQYQTAAPDSPLWQKACSKFTLADLARDVQGGSLPQVSWLMPPKLSCEHPDRTPGYGAHYISQVLDILTANPALWSSTVLLVNYDENDGFFDHVVPPTPPLHAQQGLSTVDVSGEFHRVGDYVNPADDLPAGLGARVPMLVISPWSKGGYVCSEVFDHTSVIRFLEQVFDVHEPNISPWRRAVCGDLSTAFDFSRRDALTPVLPDTSAYRALSDAQASLPVPVAPSNPVMPQQERGARLARALPYDLAVHDRVLPAQGSIQLDFLNPGRAGVVYQVYARQDSERYKTFTVEPGKSLSAQWSGVGPVGGYELKVYGPNGFLRELRGSLVRPQLAEPVVQARHDGERGELVLTLENPGAQPLRIVIHDQIHGQATRTLTLAAGQQLRYQWSVAASHHWYDLLLQVEDVPGFARRLAGHVETGSPSVFIS